MSLNFGTFCPLGANSLPVVSHLILAKWGGLCISILYIHQLGFRLDTVLLSTAYGDDKCQVEIDLDVCAILRSAFGGVEPNKNGTFGFMNGGASRTA